MGGVTCGMAGLARVPQLPWNWKTRLACAVEAAGPRLPGGFQEKLARRPSSSFLSGVQFVCPGSKHIDLRKTRTLDCSFAPPLPVLMREEWFKKFKYQTPWSSEKDLEAISRAGVACGRGGGGYRLS